MAVITSPIAINVEIAVPTALVVHIVYQGVVKTYAENQGSDLGSYVDPAGRFTMSCIRVTRADCPIEVDFRRVGDWSCAIFYYGSVASSSNANLAGYSVEISGQTIQVPAHWKFARWRWQSGPWPLPMVPIAELVAAKLLPRFDPGVNHGTAKPLGPVTYVPMGLAGIHPQMGATGARPDIGIVTDWQADYICNVTSTALANTLAQGEGGATIPWFVRDPATSAPVDPTNPKWSRASFYPGSGANPQLVGAQGSDTVGMRFSGAPGTTIKPPANWPGGPITIRDAASRDWWCYGTLTIGAVGTVDSVASAAGGGNGSPPAGELAIVGAQVSAPPVTVAMVPGGFVSGSHISLDIAHEPAVAYLPFLLTGDPYFLETLQAQVTFSALGMSGGWAAWAGQPPGAGQTRAIAWATRDYMQVAAVTPEVVPSWLLPRASMVTMFQRCIDGLTKMMNSTETLHQVMHAIASSRGTENSAAYPAGCYYQMWQEDFVQAILAWGMMLHPELESIARWHVQNLIARVNPEGTSGWCGGWPTPYSTLYQATTAGPEYATWAQAWAANMVSLGVSTCGPLSDNFLTGSGYDYPNGMQAALSIAWQAGISEAKPALDILAVALEAGLVARRGSKEWKWSLARS